MMKIQKNIAAFCGMALCAAAVFMACGTSGVTVVQAQPAGAVKNEKRGVSYSFESAPDLEMALLSPAVKWFYNWGDGLSKAVDGAAKTNNVTYFPMAWNNVDEEVLRYYKKNHPECEYLLAYNEPNLTDQANMTPPQAADRWKRLLKIAKELELKIVSPAMNYGTLSGYGDPVKWLDEFFNQPGVSLADISAIAIHCYMQNPAAMKGYIERFKKYGKPIWMTEFCAWEGIASGAAQMEYMSEAVTYMELDPAVERYAWFIPRGDEDETVKPYNKLLTQSKPPELTGLGMVYANMGVCDTAVYAAAGRQIEAEHFTNCNLSRSVGVEGFSRPVHFRPTTDSSGVLDIFDFTPEKWVEYQVEVAADKSYNISLRNTASRPTTIDVSIDGVRSQSVSLNTTSVWTTSVFPVQLSAGKHVIRLEVTGGDCALNWLKVE
jgi:hypothetical protein